ncbi:hypothetical protein WJ39_08290 [Burkholderia diffusa]|nr:hypothetical protein WJ39_08290 [Burkholderia diffusa]
MFVFRKPQPAQVIPFPFAITTVACRPATSSGPPNKLGELPVTWLRMTLAPVVRFALPGTQPAICVCAEVGELFNTAPAADVENCE